MKKVLKCIWKKITNEYRVSTRTGRKQLTIFLFTKIKFCKSVFLLCFISNGSYINLVDIKHKCAYFDDLILLKSSSGDVGQLTLLFSIYRESQPTRKPRDVYLPINVNSVCFIQYLNFYEIYIFKIFVK